MVRTSSINMTSLARHEHGTDRQTDRRTLVAGGITNQRHCGRAGGAHRAVQCTLTQKALLPANVRRFYREALFVAYVHISSCLPAYRTESPGI